MENLKGLLATVDIMNNTEAVLDSVDDLTKDCESHGCLNAEPQTAVASDTTPFQNAECNDGERAILAGYVSLIRQCIELAEKVGAAKA
ncbi:hypothetical protein B5X24_HaOG216264 [Helicoverpa armigera]|nr:hypothetical protein B5X24_HaOG216264 [Helicoverpa armigera]